MGRRKTPEIHHTYIDAYESDPFAILGPEMRPAVYKTGALEVDLMAYPEPPVRNIGIPDCS